MQVQNSGLQNLQQGVNTEINYQQLNFIKHETNISSLIAANLLYAQQCTDI